LYMQLYKIMNVLRNSKMKEKIKMRNSRVSRKLCIFLDGNYVL
jgi:hypothetical protein